MSNPTKAPATKLMELGYKSGSWQPADSDERKPRFTSFIQLFQNEDGKVFAKVDTRSLSVNVLMLMAMANAGGDRPFEMQDDVFMSVFGPGDKDPAELVYNLCYVAGKKPDRENAGQTKPVWASFAKIWKSDKGSQYARVEALAINPIILMQLRKEREEIGREVFFRCFMEKPSSSSIAAVPGVTFATDEIPF